MVGMVLHVAHRSWRGDSLLHIIVGQVVFWVSFYVIAPCLLRLVISCVNHWADEWADAEDVAYGINATPGRGTAITPQHVFHRTQREKMRTFLDRFGVGFIMPSEQLLAWLWGRYWVQ